MKKNRFILSGKTLGMYYLFLLMLISGVFMNGCKKQDNVEQEDQTSPTPVVEITPTQAITPTPIVQVAQDNIPKPEDMILDPAEWKEEFPLIYASFMKTSTMGDDTKESSDLGGSHPLDYLKEYPNIAILYEGVGFAKEYYQARGHYYALEDVINISRPKPGATCLACKTAEFEKLRLEQDIALYTTDFQKTVQDVKNGISCYNCHRNNPGEGVQTPSPHFNETVNRLNLEINPESKACAQCHVEYYFNADTKEVLLPWDNGFEIEQIEAYYDNLDYSDWIHPRTGTPLIKVQHPEFEMYSGSFHDSMNVACADCHMPTLEEDGEEYRSHWVTSPLKTPDASCGSCHGDEAKSLVKSVQTTQKKIHDKEVEVSDLLVKLTKDFAEAIENKELDDARIDNLRSLHRKAQFRWDFVFVENSTGFHYTGKAFKALEDAKAYAEEALDILGGLE